MTFRSLSDRVAALRASCVRALGPTLFDQVYRRVRDQLYAETDAAADEGDGGGAMGISLAGLALTPAQAARVDDVVALLEMEQALI
jgi:hypothetical protein